MGLADRDYTRAHAAPPRRPGERSGRILSRSPRGGLSASFILILVCSGVFLLDLALPSQFVQSSPWVVAPALRDRLSVIDRRMDQLDQIAKSARARNDADAVASALGERSSLEVLREERERVIGDAERAWESRRARGDFRVATGTAANGRSIREAFDPNLPANFDPIAICSVDAVGPIRAWL